MTLATLKEDLMIMAVFLLIGFFVREKVRFLQRLFIPSSLIGGLIVLALGEQGAGVLTVPESFSKLPGVLVGVVMAALIFGVNVNRDKVQSYLDYSFITMTAYGMQMGIGVLLGYLFQKFWKGLPDGWGVMGVFAFHGGHGTAAAAGSEFEKLGIEGNMAVGMVLSTFGLICAMALGMVIVNLGVRKGWASYIKNSTRQPEYFFSGVLPKEKRSSIGEHVTSSISINHLALQFAWLLAAYGCGRYVIQFFGRYFEFFNSLPDVLYGVFGGAILWKFVCMVQLDGYVDRKTLKLISGFLLEIVIFSAIATLNLEFVSVYFVPIALYTLILAALSIIIILFLSRLILKEGWFEKAVMAIGAAIGNTSTGLALVRAVDPETESDAGDAHGIYSTIMSWKDIFTGLTPVWLSTGVTLTAGVGFGIMIGSFLLAMLFSGKFFRKA